MGRDDARRHEWMALLMLWLAGNALRLTILAVPPVIATIRDEFHLSATQVGLLGSIGPALFAIAAMAGSLIVARLGVRAALVGGLVIVAVGSALRGLSGNYAVLLATTIFMAAGVAIMQPIMPTAVRHWVPSRIGLATAIYTNGLLVGEVIPVMLTIPVVLPLVGGSWRGSLVVWSALIALIAVIVQMFAPHVQGEHAFNPGRLQKWVPDWRSPLVWRLGILFGCVNSVYFSTNAFIPVFLANSGRSDLIGPTLTALNFGQLPASALLLVTAHRLERSALPYLVSGLLSLLSVIGMIGQSGAMSVLWAGVLGFSDAAALIVGLTLPAMLCRPEDVARTAAGAFTISYGSAVVIAVIGGALWDVTGIPAMAFVPIALCAGGLVLSTLWMRAKRELI
ncbi:MAG TPA: MFS transporter [Casimicrobiaceae bacterium]|nr:MFS transporter [Casimicrobiaceae bacterium]